MNKKSYWETIIEIETGANNNVCSGSGKKLEFEYMVVKSICLIHRNPETTTEYFNRSHSPEKFKRHWRLFDEKKKNQIEMIRAKMKKYNIKKSQI